MGILKQAFEKPAQQKDASLLGQLFSLPIIRGFYKDEKPAVDVKLDGNKYEKHRMISLINAIANNSPTGRRILEEAAKEGYSFGFEYQPGSYGFCSAEQKVICLNPKTKDSTLVATLVHEARHAQQHTHGIPPQFCTFDIATELKLRRAMEADAQAASAQAALEIRASTKNEAVWKRFEKTSGNIAKDIEKPTLSASLDSVIANSEKNMRAAFKGWFKNWRTVDAYEQSYLYSHLFQADKFGEQEKALAYFAEKPFEGSISSADILKTICTTDKGKCYFANDLDIMDREAAMCGICQDTREAADTFFKERVKATGKAPDESYKNLPNRGNLFENLRIIAFSRPGKTSDFSIKTNLLSLKKHRGR